VSGWDSKGDLLRMLAGPTFCDVVQPGKPLVASDEPKKGKPIMLVFYVGGVTYAEIAALRCAAKKSPYDIIIATTKVLNGTGLIQSLMTGQRRSE